MKMEEKNNNPIEDITSSIKDYLRLKLDESKLDLVENLSLLFGKIIFFFLATIVISIAAGFLSVAFYVWMSSLLGPILGAIITSSIFLIIFIFLYIFRKRLFSDFIVRMFIQMLFKNGKYE